MSAENYTSYNWGTPSTDSPQNSFVTVQDDYSVNRGDAETDATARRSPTFGWSNEHEFKTESDEDIKLAYEPRTSFKPEKADDDVDSQKFSRLRSLHHEWYYASKYEPRIPDFAKTDRIRLTKKTESRKRNTLSYAIAERIVSRPLAKRVITLLSRTELDEGPLNAYSFEEITLGLCALFLNKNRPIPQKGYERTEALEIQEENQDRLKRMKEHLNQLRYNDSAKINDADFNTIKAELRKQHPQFRQ